MRDDAASAHRSGWTAGDTIVLLNLVAKTVLVVLLVRVVLDPSWGNLEGKAPVARAVIYPLLAFVIPAVWWARGRHSAYPWLPDLLVTLACFGDILGNRLDLYDSVAWFDDAIHFAATGVVSAAVVLLTLRRGTLWQAVERAVAVGMTGSLAWEVFEYFSFITRSSELKWAYRDTVGDLVLGWLGAVTAAMLVATYWRVTRPPGEIVLSGPVGVVPIPIATRGPRDLG